MYYPKVRLRRLRRTETLRRLVRETKVSIDDIICPLFVIEGEGIKEPISSMPDQYRFSIDLLIDEIQEVRNLGILAVILFGVPTHKDSYASQAYALDGIIQRAIKSIKERISDLIIITDVCVCEYTDHGHCGFVKDGQVDNEESVELLVKTAVSHASAGANIVAPSAMMDGQVAAIRKGLDANGFQDVPILSYAAKFASAFYGPFREAAESSPKFGDRRSYQMDPGNGNEALREVHLDIEEGVDMVMVKPALPYLDLIHRVRQSCNLPVAAYNVSGEYAMIKAAAAVGWIDESLTIMECMTAIKRAGANLIITYFAKDVARYLQKM